MKKNISHFGRCYRSETDGLFFIFFKFFEMFSFNVLDYRNTKYKGLKNSFPAQNFDSPPLILGPQ